MDDYAKGMKLALYALGRKMLTVWEVREYLIKKEIDTHTAGEIITKLQASGYLNDKTYAEHYAQTRIHKDGRVKLKYNLKRKGVEEEYIQSALNSLDPQEEINGALLYARRALRGEGDYKARQRAYAALSRRGYMGDIAREAIKEAISELE